LSGFCAARLHVPSSNAQCIGYFSLHLEYGATSALERMGTGSRTNPMTVKATVNAGNAAAHLQLFALSGMV
jgi:hypothetical protein